MQQQPLFGNEPAAEVDTDVAQAIAFFRPVVLEIRQLSAQAFTLPERSAARAAVEEQIQDRVSGIGLRATRVGLTCDDLLAKINADLKASPPPHDYQPHGEFLRHLLDENTAAHADEAQTNREIERLQANLKRAVMRRRAADGACAGFVAGHALRGGPRA